MMIQGMLTMPCLVGTESKGLASRCLSSPDACIAAVCVPYFTLIPSGSLTSAIARKRGGGFGSTDKAGAKYCLYMDVPFSTAKRTDQPAYAASGEEEQHDEAERGREEEEEEEEEEEDDEEEEEEEE